MLENRVYLNPNMAPDYFYSKIKSLTLIYDQILVWAPVVSWLEEGGFLVNDFLSACQPYDNDPPAIVPVARASLFDTNLRSAHPDEVRRQVDSAFDKRIKVFAEQANRDYGFPTILKTSDYERGYRMVDAICENPVGLCRIKEAAKTLRDDLGPGMVAAAEDVAARQGKPKEWAIANMFAQDILAVHTIGVAAPLVTPEYAKGYLLLSETVGEATSTIRQVRKDAPEGRQLPKLPPGVDTKELKEFLDTAWRASSLPWKEVRGLRKEKSKAIRRWLNSALEPRRRPIGKTVSEIASIRSRALRMKFDAAAGVIPPLVLSSILGIETGAVAGLVQFLSHFKLTAPLAKPLAKHLGGADRILVDTPYWVSSDSKK